MLNFSDNFYEQSEPGVVCVFSLKNPSYPEFLCHAPCGVMCLDFHPEHPHMLVVGLYDGNIAVYNLQKNTGSPSYQSDAKNGKHRDIVWQVIIQMIASFEIIKDLCRSSGLRTTWTDTSTSTPCLGMAECQTGP